MSDWGGDGLESEQKARKLAELLGGHYFNSGGGVWLAYVERSDGKIVAFSDELVAVYNSVDEIGGDPISEIELV